MMDARLMAAIDYAGLSAIDTAKYQFLQTFISMLDEQPLDEIKREVEQIVLAGQKTRAYKKWLKQYEASK